MSSAGCEELYSLRPGVYSVDGPDDTLHVAAWPYSLALGRSTPWLTALLRALAADPHPADELRSLADGEEVSETLAELKSGGWLSTLVRYDGDDLYTLEPLRPPPARPAPPGDEPLVLSRYAVIHRDQRGLLVESPRSWCDLRPQDDRVLTLVAAPASTTAAVPAPVRTRLVGDLRWADIAVPQRGPEDDFELRQWSPHELWFHHRSRLGYRGYFGKGFGRTHWAKDEFPPVPGRREDYPGPAVDLHRPDLDRLRDTDPPLSAVLEERRSVRSHGAEPITGAQLGEFLYRTARVRARHTLDGVDFVSKPYPSGGSAYELEVYPVVDNVSGVDSGLYHYDAHDHRLRKVAAPTHPAVRRLLNVAGHTGLLTTRPQVLLVIAARVGRLMWTYESIPYALILKHVGALYQTMYCVATAMGLAPCALGSGDAVGFGEATGTDPLVETSVGEFILGSRGPDRPESP